MKIIKVHGQKTKNNNPDLYEQFVIYILFLKCEIKKNKEILFNILNILFQFIKLYYL